MLASKSNLPQLVNNVMLKVSSSIAYQLSMLLSYRMSEPTSQSPSPLKKAKVCVKHFLLSFALSHDDSIDGFP